MGDQIASASRPARPLAVLKPPTATAFLAPPLIAWLWLLALIAIGMAHTVLGHHPNLLTEFFFYAQDLPVAGLMLLLTSALYLVPARTPTRLLAPDWRTVSLIALAVVAFAWAGSFLIYDNFALSMDEFMARFDAQILASGRLAAPVPPEWRAYVDALQMRFLLDTPGHAWWVSGYLPVNAAFLALASRLGAENLMPAFWAGLSVLAVFGVARRLWPDKPGAALVAAGLLATSPQLLITAMTPYAMSAHLALNLVWLWLVLRGGRLGHGAAAGVAFLATGLHQLIFHPLFAAPFVLELWLARRWKPALWHTSAYLAIGCFWALYPSPLLHALSAASGSTDAASGSGMLLRAFVLLRGFQFADVGYVVKNLVRFSTWQSLLAVPLALVALPGALRAGGPLRAMVLGFVLTLTTVILLMPYQGHGWGYRYLHGLLGSTCLLAAWAWERLAKGSDAPAPARRAAFAAAAIATLALVLPLRAWQAHAFEHPYAVAVREIQATPADIVLVDDVAAPFAMDLVRNSPFLTNRPLVLGLTRLNAAQVRDLCARGAVAVYDRKRAKAAGLGLIRPGVSKAQDQVADLIKLAHPAGKSCSLEQRAGHL
jgi:hypothetical protein